MFYVGQTVLTLTFPVATGATQGVFGYIKAIHEHEKADTGYEVMLETDETEWFFGDELRGY